MSFYHDGNLRKGALDLHERSPAHVAAVEALKKGENISRQQPNTAKVFSSENEFFQKVIESLWHCEPLSRIDSWAKMRRKLGDPNCKFHRRLAKLFGQACAEVIRRANTEMRSRALVVALMIDDSSFIDNKEWQSVQLSVSNNGLADFFPEVRGFLHAVVRLHHGEQKAEGMLSVLSALEGLNWDKIMALGTDAAPVMKCLFRLVRETFQPYLEWDHCKSHRFQIALKRGVLNIVEFDELIDGLDSLHSFFKTSTNMQSFLEQLVSVVRSLEEERSGKGSRQESLKRVKDLMRWSDIKEGSDSAVSLFPEVYRVVLIQGLRTDMKADRRDWVRTLLEFFSDYRRLCDLCVLQAAAEHANLFHKNAQKRDTDLAKLDDEIDDVIMNFQDMVDPGKKNFKSIASKVKGLLKRVRGIPDLAACEKKLKLDTRLSENLGGDEEAFIDQLVRERGTELVEGVVGEIRDLFDEDQRGLRGAFSIFNPSRWPKTKALTMPAARKACESYGEHAIEEFSAWYGVPRSCYRTKGQPMTPPINEDRLREQWPRFCVVMNRFIRPRSGTGVKSFRELSQKLRELELQDKRFREESTEWLYLMGIYEVRSGVTVENERTFSVQNRVEHPLRLRLDEHQIEDYVLIAHEARRKYKTLEDFAAFMIPRAKPIYAKLRRSFEQLRYAEQKSRDQASTNDDSVEPLIDLEDDEDHDGLPVPSTGYTLSNATVPIFGASPHPEAVSIDTEASSVLLVGSVSSSSSSSSSASRTNAPKSSSSTSTSSSSHHASKSSSVSAASSSSSCVATPESKQPSSVVEMSAVPTTSDVVQTIGTSTTQNVANSSGKQLPAAVLPMFRHSDPDLPSPRELKSRRGINIHKESTALEYYMKEKKAKEQAKKEAKAKAKAEKAKKKRKRQSQKHARPKPRKKAASAASGESSKAEVEDDVSSGDGAGDDVSFGQRFEQFSFANRMLNSKKVKKRQKAPQRDLADDADVNTSASTSSASVEKRKRRKTNHPGASSAKPSLPRKVSRHARKASAVDTEDEWEQSESDDEMSDDVSAGGSDAEVAKQGFETDRVLRSSRSRG